MCARYNVFKYLLSLYLTKFAPKLLWFGQTFDGAAKI